MISDKIPRLEFPVSSIKLGLLFLFEFDVVAIRVAVGSLDGDGLAVVGVSICTFSLGFSSDCSGDCGLTIHVPLPPSSEDSSWCRSRVGLVDTLLGGEVVREGGCDVAVGVTDIEVDLLSRAATLRGATIVPSSLAKPGRYLSRSSCFRVS